MNAFRWLARAFFARIGWFAAGALLLFLGFDAKAHTCPSGQEHINFTVYWSSCPSASGGNYATEQAAADACQSEWEAGASSLPGFSVDGASWFCQFGGEDCNPRYRNIQWHWDNQPGGTSSAFPVQHHCGVPTCNESANASLDLPDPFNTQNGATLCVNNCVVTAFVGLAINGGTPSRSGTIAFGQVGSTPQACTDSNEPEPIRPRTCFSEDGLTICAYNDDPEQVSDGFIDNDPEPDTESATDADQLDQDEDGCVVLASGGAFCVVNAPGTPDNGIPGQPAEPDAVVQGGGGFAANNTYNYFDNSTVNNSTNLGDAPIEGDGSDSAGECDPEDTECIGGGRGDGRVKGPGGTAMSFGDALSSFGDRVGASGVGQLGTAMGTAIPDTGTCPTASFSVFAETFTLESHCEILDQYYATLRAIFGLMWIGLGALIILRA